MVQAEDKIVNNTREVVPGVILTGMELAETVRPTPAPSSALHCFNSTALPPLLPIIALPVTRPH